VTLLYGYYDLNYFLIQSSYQYSAVSNPIWDKTFPHHNAFQLDPCKGYPLVFEYDSNVLDYSETWPRLDYSSYENMLDITSDLKVNFQEIFLKTRMSRNELPWQMSFWDKYKIGLELLKPSPLLIPTFGTFFPFFYQDNERSYYVNQEFYTGTYEYNYVGLKTLLKNKTDITSLLQACQFLTKNMALAGPNYRFTNFYHPLACQFIRTLTAKGIGGLFTRDVQLQGDPIFKPESDFIDTYNPVYYMIVGGTPYTYWNGNTDPSPAYPKIAVDYDLISGDSLYNWEFFFHNLLMIAMRCSQNQQFEEADRWFKYIFNPSDTSTNQSPQRYWITKPFFELASDNTTIDQLITLLDLGSSSPTIRNFMNEVTSWKNDPYNAHGIARTRISAYMKTTVMKYLDNIIAWADFNFQQHTFESVNFAIQLYFLALELLGRKPEAIPSAFKPPVMNYYQLETNLDQIITNLGSNPDASVSDPLVLIENLLPSVGYATSETYNNEQKLPTLLFFCIPPNQKLLRYWDKVEQELYKIRHCLNIKGQFDPLSPFPPDIDLDNADLDGLNDLNGILHNYRFSVMAQKATELCNEVKALGSALLTTLEKKDAEELSLLRSHQEIDTLKAIMLVREKQIIEAQAGLDNLNKYKDLVKTKIDYYDKLVGTGLNVWELAALNLNASSTAIDASIAVGYALSGGLKLIPDFIAGVAGFGASPTATFKLGGSTFGNSAEDLVKTLSSIATAIDKVASITSTVGGYARRKDEWEYQLKLSNAEMEQVKLQIDGALARLNIAKQEKENQDKLINNAEDIDDFMRNQKFTNQQVYTWMITQISTVYFQSYQLAYQTAKQAEHCFRFELGLSTSSYITYGYWDSLKKGLLSGDRLMYAIKKMETDYLELDIREFELIKHISLFKLDAVALLQLIENKNCFINVPEELFDVDFPGHYFRRIKSVSISIPCITGPYISVNCTLTLIKNSIRIDNTAGGNYKRKLNSNGVPATDKRFRDNIAAVQSIVTSHAKDDSGTIVNKESKYNPFEEAGAISTWHLELSEAFQQFDYKTISDVILHLKYTSRDGGPSLRDAAKDNITSRLNTIIGSAGEQGLLQMFSAKRDFPNEWHQFIYPPIITNDQKMVLKMSQERFPYFIQDLIKQGKSMKIKSIELVADGNNIAGNVDALVLSPNPVQPYNFIADSKYENLLHTQLINYNNLGLQDISFSLPVANKLTSDDITDLIVILYYEVS
jgi:hypothetical protein